MIRGGTTLSFLSLTFVEYGNEKPLEVLSEILKLYEPSS